MNPKEILPPLPSIKAVCIISLWYTWHLLLWVQNPSVWLSNHSTVDTSQLMLSCKLQKELYFTLAISTFTYLKSKLLGAIENLTSFGWWYYDPSFGLNEIKHPVFQVIRMNVKLWNDFAPLNHKFFFSSYRGWIM